MEMAGLKAVIPPLGITVAALLPRIGTLGFMTAMSILRQMVIGSGVTWLFSLPLVQKPDFHA